MNKTLDIKIFPSLIAADMGHLTDACRRCQASGSDGIHLDIMDGHFVPNITIGPDFVRMSKSAAPDLYRHVHLMVTNPQDVTHAFIDAGAQAIIFHIEARVEPASLIAEIRQRGVMPGLAINPETPAHLLRPYLDAIDEVLVMTVHPGFGGQSFMSEVLPKISEIRAMAPDMPISVDGGVTLETGPQCVRAGANRLVAGTALFRAADMAHDIHTMKERCRSTHAVAAH